MKAGLAQGRRTMCAPLVHRALYRPCPECRGSDQRCWGQRAVRRRLVKAVHAAWRDAVYWTGLLFLALAVGRIVQEALS